MARIGVEGDRLVVTLQGWEQVWALKQRIDVPLSAVRSVRVNDDQGLKPSGFRAPGSYWPFWPGKIMAGTYRKRGSKQFWSVRDPMKAVVIDLEGADYARLVIQVPDAAATAAMLRNAIGD